MEKISTHDYVGNLTTAQQEDCESIRARFKEVEEFIITCIEDAEEDGNCEFSKRCFAIVRTKLEEACMFAIKGIVFQGKDVL